MGFFTCQLAHQVLDHWHTSGTAHQHHLVYLRGSDLGIGKRALKRATTPSHQIFRQLLEFGTRQLHLQVLGTAGIRCNERQVDLSLQHRTELNLGLLSGLLKALQCLAILTQIDAVFFAKLLSHPVHNTLIPVIAPEVSVPVGRFHFDHTVTHFEQAHIEGTTTQVPY